MLNIDLNIGKRKLYRIGNIDRMSKRNRGFTGKPYSWDIHREFAKYLAEIIRTEFSNAIDDQRFKRWWPPLNMNYLRYKRVHHLSMKTWKATGLLQKSIVAKRRAISYYVGVDPNKRYRNGAKVIDIAACMEYGTSRMPARPLFRPIFEDIRKNVKNYWEDFLELNNISHDEVNTRFTFRDRLNRLKNRFNPTTELNESLEEDYYPTIANNPPGINPFNSPVSVARYVPGGGGFGPTSTSSTNSASGANSSGPTTLNE